MKKSLFILFILFFVSACSTSIPINYIPAPIIRGNSEISVGNVNYIPAMNGKVKENEMQKATGAIGAIYTTAPIAEIVKTSFQKELLSAGFSIEDAAKLNIDINVDRFLYDWIGFVEVDFYIDMTFTVSKNGIEVFKYMSKAHQAAPKTMTSDSEAIKSAMSVAFSDFLLAARKQKVF